MGFLCVLFLQIQLYTDSPFLCLLPLFSLRYPFEVNGLNLRKCPIKLQFLDFEPCIAPFSLPSVLWTERFRISGRMKNEHEFELRSEPSRVYLVERSIANDSH